MNDTKNRSMLVNGKTDIADDEVNDLLPQDTQSPQDVDDLLGSMGTRGLDVVEGESPSPFSTLEQRTAHDSEEVELDLTPGAPDSASDPVRVYLREMGASPLLTREEEVEIAKRIERGQVTSLKALSRSPIVIQQVLAIGEDLKRGLRSIKVENASPHIALTRAQAATLLLLIDTSTLIGKRNYAIIKLLLHTGLRRSECGGNRGRTLDPRPPGGSGEGAFRIAAIRAAACQRQRARHVRAHRTAE